ncbi:hypothetical protein GUJ93_ZPchr0002g24991 [Zizania palustris]|uniref:Uncharacterized protein n=1 Tax=Zizania palustris TaxID=103762 RepID=A0A8J5SN76_ZIZPA|nr:hypothetical protein GUJ93_ZPchr0002g24991 [Zizania palustris]
MWHEEYHLEQLLEETITTMEAVEIEPQIALGMKAFIEHAGGEDNTTTTLAIPVPGSRFWRSNRRILSHTENYLLFFCLDVVCFWFYCLNKIQVMIMFKRAWPGPTD